MESRLREPYFRREGVGFVGQDFQIAGGAAHVAHVGKTRRVLCGLEEQLLLRAEFPRLAIRDQGIGDAAKGSQNRLLVKQRSRLLLGLGQTHSRAKSTPRKDRLSEQSAKTPHAGRSREQIRERRTLDPATATEHDLGKI